MPTASALMGLAAAVAFACILLLGLLWWLRRWASDSFTGLADTLIVASDAGVVPPRLLRDSRVGLFGKPDYVLAQGTGAERRLIPVELKPRRRATRLYESDEIQLGVCLLGMRATYGQEAAGFGFVRKVAILRASILSTPASILKGIRVSRFG